MPIRDDNMDYIRKRVYWPAVANPMWEMLAEATGTGSAQNITHALGATPVAVTMTHTESDGTATDLAYGTHTASTVVVTIVDSAQKAVGLAGITGTEVSTFGFPGVRMGTAGDVVAFGRRIPLDVDPQYAMGFKVHFTSGSSTLADGFTWIALLDFKATDAALIAPATALDTAIAEVTLPAATAYLNSWSSRGIKNANFLTRAQIEAGAAMLLSIELDATDSTLASEPCMLLGVEIDYVPRLTQGHGKVVDVPLTG